MSSYQEPPESNHRKLSHLSQKHRKTLLEESAIDPGVADRAGVFTVRRGKDVPQESGWLPSRPGMVFPTHTLDGETFPRLRLDTPSKLPKYMQPKGAPNRLYIHPDQHERIKEPGRVRFVTEGEKKVLAGVSHGLLMIGLSGVYNGQKDGKLIPDWDLLPLEGEAHAICYDSDILQNENVQLAAERQAELLAERGAKVYMTILPDAPGRGKQGLDDFLAAGGTVKELRMLTRKYEPGMFGNIRLSRDEKLRLAVELLERKFWDFAWGAVVGASESGKPNSMRGHGCRDVVKVLIDEARERGKSDKDGVRVRISTRTLALKGATSRQTVMKSIKHLAVEEWLVPDYSDAKDKAASYVLLMPRATLDQYEEEQRQREQATTELQEFDRRGKGLRAPRLRWSSPGRKAKRGTITGTRRVRQSKQPARPGYKRLGKIRGAILDALADAGGAATVGEIAEALHRTRPRDLRRRNLPMLEDDGIIIVDGDLVTLADNWLERLEEVRESAGEIQAEERDTARFRIQREAFRRRDEVQPGRCYLDVGADGYVEDLERPPDELAPDDRKALEAIEAFEEKFGSGSFKWNHAGAKEMFYSGPIAGLWPDSDQLRRIREHLALQRMEAA